jgi:hypothetical protein
VVQAKKPIKKEVKIEKKPIISKGKIDTLPSKPKAKFPSNKVKSKELPVIAGKNSQKLDVPIEKEMPAYGNDEDFEPILFDQDPDPWPYNDPFYTDYQYDADKSNLSEADEDKLLLDSKKSNIAGYLEAMRTDPKEVESKMKNKKLSSKDSLTEKVEYLLPPGLLLTEDDVNDTHDVKSTEKPKPLKDSGWKNTPIKKPKSSGVDRASTKKSSEYMKSFKGGIK